MININVKIDFSKVIAKLDKLRREQMPYATAKALTATAQAVKKDLQSEMKQVFDRPTPFTLNSIYVKAARKNDLTATVGLKDGAKYLYPQIFGGGRKLKNFERALQSRNLLPSGMYAVPGSAAKLDKYGNMSKGQLMQILSALNVAEMTSGYLANRLQRMSGRTKKNQAQFFVGKPGNRLPLGVWQRFGFTHGSAVKPVIIFVQKVAYKPRFKFFEVAQATTKREVAAQFYSALDDALRTAR